MNAFFANILFNTVLKPLEGKKSTIANVMLFFAASAQGIAYSMPQYADSVSWLLSSQYWAILTGWCGVAYTDRARRLEKTK